MLIPMSKKRRSISQLNYLPVCGLLPLFEQDHASHQFQAGTGFEDVFNLYVFDRELRLLVLDAIERFEVSLRTQLATTSAIIIRRLTRTLKPQIFHNPVIYGACLNKLDNDINRAAKSLSNTLLKSTKSYSHPSGPWLN